MDRLALTFGKDDDVAKIKAAIEENTNATHVEFVECRCLDDAAMKKIVPKLNAETISLCMQSVEFSEKTIKMMLKQCQSIQDLHFVDNQHIDIESCLSIIGLHAPKLTAISFRNITDQPLLFSDVLSTLVKNCAVDLTSITFNSFPSLSDIGVKYVAECYFTSLQSVDFNGCVNLTDSCLVSLCSNCRLLRDVRLRSTHITNFAVGLLAAKCARLVTVDFSDCPDLGDAGVRVLARQCHLLANVYIAGCPLLGDDALEALLSSCPQLETVDFSRTRLAVVPMVVLVAKKLRELKLDSCRDLVQPPARLVSEQGLTGIRQYYMEYNLSYRLKVFTVGYMGSGKTSVISSLVQGRATTAVESTETVHTQLWQPFLQHANVKLAGKILQDDEKQLVLDMWDLSGRPVCQGVHQNFFTAGALYLVVFDITDTTSCRSVVSQVQLIQAKVPGSVIMFVGTKGDHLPMATNWRERANDILDIVRNAEHRWTEKMKEQIAQLETLKEGNHVSRQCETISHLLKHRPVFANTVHIVSCVTGQGLADLRRDFLQCVCDGSMFRHLGHTVTPAELHLYALIMRLRSGLDNGATQRLVVRWNALTDFGLKMMTSQKHLKTTIAHLHVVGGVLELRQACLRDSRSSHFVILAPAAVAAAAAATHQDDRTRAVTLDAGRFWAAGDARPDARTLVSSLEETPAEGLVREVLLPLIWQAVRIDEAQVQLLVAVLRRLGLLMAYCRRVDNTDTTSLLLPHYPHLSHLTTFYLPLMGRLSSHRPQLSWTPRPSRGDAQLTWRVVFPHGCPGGLPLRLMAVCHAASTKHSYEHCWAGGLLLRLGQELLCVECERNQFDISCRMNLDEPGRETQRMELMWAHLAVFILAIDRFLLTLPGLFYKVLLVPLGLPLFYGDVVAVEKTFPLFTCLDRLATESDIEFHDKNLKRRLHIARLFPFPVAGFDVSGWIHFIASKMELVISLSTASESYPVLRMVPAEPLAHEEEERVKQPRSAAKTKSLRWDLDEMSVIGRSEPRPTLSSPPPALPVDSGAGGLSGEQGDDQLDLLQKVAAGFVATLLARSAAHLLRLEHEKGTNGRAKVSTDEVVMAEMTAAAVAAGQAGHSEQAVHAVIASAEYMQQALQRQQQRSRSGVCSSVRSSGGRGVRSGFCAIL